jgi:hypothetical protein
LALRIARVNRPVLDLCGQQARPSGRILLAHDAVAAHEHPVENGDAARSRVEANEGALPLRLIQVQRGFRVHDEGEQGDVALRRAVAEAVHDDLAGARRHDPPQLPSAPVALLGDVPRGGPGRLLTTRQPAQVDIQDRPVGLVGMAIRLTLSPEDRVPSGFQLLDGLLGTRIQRVLHHRWLGTGGAPKRRLQRRIGTPPPVDLDQAVGAGQQGDEGVIERVGGAGADGFLGDVDLLADGAKQVEMLPMHAEGRQTGVCSAVLHRGTVESGTVRHGSRFFLFGDHACKGRSDRLLSVKSQRRTPPLVRAKFG